MGIICINWCKKKILKHKKSDELDINLNSSLITIDKSSSSMPKISSSSESDIIFSKENKLDVFKILKNLGKGNFGKVYLVRSKIDDKFYAMKVLRKQKIKELDNVNQTKAEREILEKLNHPFIMKLRYAFQTVDKLHLVTDFMQGGELFTHLHKESRFEESKAIFYISEVILAIEYLHKNNIIYRDLKPENILIGSDGHIKLTDFGLSKILINSESTKSYTICGTPEYLAPEVINSRGYDKNIDWWSVGALFYKLLSGVSPIKNNKGKSYDISNYGTKIDTPHYFSYDAKSFIYDILQVDPQLRLGSKRGADEIKEHALFNKVNWKLLAMKKIKPPLIPITNNETDLKYFDLTYTEKTIRNSPDDPTRESLDNSIYADFSYNENDKK